MQDLFAQAESADQANVPDGVSLPAEIKRREDRLAAMAAARVKIAARAEERYQREKAEYEQKMASRAAKENDSGKKPGGKPPQAPTPGPKDSDQINLTDAESRIMPVSGGGFEQCYNAQAAVDAATMLVVATGLTQAPNDKEQVAPMLATLKAQTEALGVVERLIADTSFSSEKNIKACEAADIEPLIRWPGKIIIRAGANATASPRRCPPTPRRCRSWRINYSPVSNIGDRWSLKE